METKRCISSLTLEQLTAELKAMGQPGFRAKQIFHWVHQKLVTDFSAMTDQPKALLAKLEEAFYIAAPIIERRQEAKDGTVKYRDNSNNGTYVNGRKLLRDTARLSIGDVLAFPKDRMVLLTGLTNPHTVRTAELLDVMMLIFVRGKRPDETVLSLARQKDITILATPYRMFTACGLLYENGLEGGCDVS